MPDPQDPQIPTPGFAQIPKLEPKKQVNAEQREELQKELEQFLRALFEVLLKNHPHPAPSLTDEEKLKIVSLVANYLLENRMLDKPGMRLQDHLDFFKENNPQLLKNFFNIAAMGLVVGQTLMQKLDQQLDNRLDDLSKRLENFINEKAQTLNMQPDELKQLPQQMNKLLQDFFVNQMTPQDHQDMQQILQLEPINEQLENFNLPKLQPRPQPDQKPENEPAFVDNYVNLYGLVNSALTGSLQATIYINLGNGLGFPDLNPYSESSEANIDSLYKHTIRPAGETQGLHATLTGEVQGLHPALSSNILQGGQMEDLNKLTHDVQSQMNHLPSLTPR